MLQIIFGKQIFVFLKSRREDYESSPQFRTQMGDGYDFFAATLAELRKFFQEYITLNIRHVSLLNYYNISWMAQKCS